MLWVAILGNQIWCYPQDQGRQETQCRDCAQDGEGAWIQVVLIIAVAKTLSLYKQRFSSRFSVAISNIPTVGRTLTMYLQCLGLWCHEWSNVHTQCKKMSLRLVDVELKSTIANAFAAKNMTEKVPAWCSQRRCHTHTYIYISHMHLSTWALKCSKVNWTEFLKRKHAETSDALLLRNCSFWDTPFILRTPVPFWDVPDQVLSTSEHGCSEHVGHWFFQT